MDERSATGVTLPSNVIELGHGFYNIRGSFKIGKVLDIGTQASVIRRKSGRFVMLDACALDEATGAWLDRLTEGGALLEAVLHVHPFHTVFARRLHARYPQAALHGTRRHREVLPDLPWAAELTEEALLHDAFAADLAFSVPAGVDFVSDNPRLHFSSVLVFHRASRTLHVDDTLTHVRLPRWVRALKTDVTSFHPTLKRVLQPRAGAVGEFRTWARALVEQSRDVENLCAAHSAALIGARNEGPSVSARIEQALHKVEPTLAAHERKHG